MTPRYDITGFIGDSPNTSAEVGRFLDANPGPVEAIINSPGGYVHEGVGIFAAFERHGNVTAIVQGLAASSASLLMLGARRVKVHDGALIMIHEATVVVGGTADKLRKVADEVDKNSLSADRLYSRATG